MIHIHKYVICFCLCTVHSEGCPQRFVSKRDREPEPSPYIRKRLFTQFFSFCVFVLWIRSESCVLTAQCSLTYDNMIWANEQATLDNTTTHACNKCYDILNEIYSTLKTWIFVIRISGRFIQYSWLNKIVFTFRITSCLRKQTNISKEWCMRGVRRFTFPVTTTWIGMGIGPRINTRAGDIAEPAKTEKIMEKRTSVQKWIQSKSIKGSIAIMGHASNESNQLFIYCQ